MLLNILTFQFPGASLKEKISLQYRQLAFLISTDLSVVEGLAMLIEQCKDRRTLRVLMALKRALVTEHYDTDTPVAFPSYYNHALVFILKQENHNEKIAAFLHEIADKLDDSSEITKRALSAMTYPFMLFIMAIMITSVLLIFVIPVFEEMFFSFGSSLPMPTQIILSISKALLINKHFFLAGIIIIVIVCCKLKRFFLTLFTYIPLAGSILKNISLLQFTQYLAVMLKIKTPLRQAVLYSAFAVDNPIFANKFKNMTDSLDKNMNLSDAMKETGVFPNILTQVAALSEKSQSLDKILKHISKYYEKLINSSLYNLTIIYNITTILVIGFIVGFLVIAMYLPIFTMAGGL
ncbi:MAG: type II secretion system F family protein [Desulfobacteraceae bacterium]|nr:type II secretion system F family protein [Desulfobacteraceae bacterium]